MKKWTMIGAVLVAGAFALNAGELVSEGADGSAALRVKSSAGALSIAVTGQGTNLSVVIGGHTNAVTGCTNAAQYVAAIVACTNASGTKTLSVDDGASLSTDTLLANLLTGTYTADENQWAELLWDTSQCKFYQVYLPKASVSPGSTALKVTRIIGEPTGTGTVTVNVYVEKVEKDRRVFESPYYVLPATWLSDGNAVSTNANTSVDTINLDIPVEVTKGSSQGVIIRATRATTATTGVLGVSVE